LRSFTSPKPRPACFTSRRVSGTRTTTGARPTRRSSTSPRLPSTSRTRTSTGSTPTRARSPSTGRSGTVEPAPQPRHPFAGTPAPGRLHLLDRPLEFAGVGKVQLERVVAVFEPVVEIQAVRLEPGEPLLVRLEELHQQLEAAAGVVEHLRVIGELRQAFLH